MSVTLPMDLASLDAEVERAFRAWGRHRRALARDPEANADVDVFVGRPRVVAVKSTRDALLAHDASALDVPLRDALARWVAFLTASRLVREDDVAVAQELVKPRGRLDLDPPRLVSAREAHDGLLSALAEAPADVPAYAAALAEAAPHVGARLHARAERRAAVLARMDLAPSAPFAPSRAEELDALAERWLRATRDVAREACRHVLRHDAALEGAPEPSRGGSPLFTVRAALARGAGDGWPARLTRRWIEDLFGAHTRGLTLEVALPSRVLGAASFVRALEAFGFALRAASPSRGPFALRADPEPLDAWRVGGAFASLGASAAFHRRALGVGARVAAGQARALALTLVFEARLRAASWRVARDPACFEEVTDDLFGAPLPEALAGVWPWARDDDGTRLVAAIEAPLLARELVERHDEDWFQNPRAFVELRARAALPARDLPAGPLDVAADRAARLAEEALA